MVLEVGVEEAGALVITPDFEERALDGGVVAVPTDWGPICVQL